MRGTAARRVRSVVALAGLLAACGPSRRAGVDAGMDASDDEAAYDYDFGTDLGPDLTAACDVDHDGHYSDDSYCGGDDCDDNDPHRFPGNTEVCDGTDHDCDLTTFGEDRDHDGHAPTRCCQYQPGMPVCGDDCDDGDPSITTADVGNPAACGSCGTTCAWACRPSADFPPVWSCDDPVELTAGGQHACIVQTSGAVYCWGANSHGEVGDGTTTDRTRPVAVALPGGGGRYVAAGRTHTCEITGESLACWGANDHGQLGDGTTTERHTPTVVPSFLANGVVAGVDFTCFDDLSLGGVQCFGANDRGQLDDGTTTERHTPTPAMNLTTLPSHGLGLAHGCGIGTVAGLGAVACWGADDVGQLGDMMTTDSSIPVRYVDYGTTLDIAAADESSCVVDQYTAGPRCFGSSTRGQLGDGGASTVVQLDAVDGGAAHYCAIDHLEGYVWCWGANDHGQLGDGTTTDNASAVQVPGIVSATRIAAGDDFSCALDVHGHVSCWGANDHGQLGDGTTTSRSTPAAIAMP